MGPIMLLVGGPSSIASMLNRRVDHTFIADFRRFAAWIPQPILPFVSPNNPGSSKDVVGPFPVHHTNRAALHPNASLEWPMCGDVAIPGVDLDETWSPRHGGSSPPPCTDLFSMKFSAPKNMATRPPPQ